MKLQFNQSSKNNPYYYEMKQITDGIKRSVSNCKDVHKLLDEYCVCSDKNAYDDFKCLQKSNIKIQSDVAFIKKEMKDIVSNTNEITRRIDNFDKTFQMIMKENNDVMNQLKMFYVTNNNSSNSSNKHNYSSYASISYKSSNNPNNSISLQHLNNNLLTRSNHISS